MRHVDSKHKNRMKTDIDKKYCVSLQEKDTGHTDEDVTEDNDS